MPRKPPMGWRGVCLLQGFCPFCFKGEIGKSCGRRVPSTSRHIDEVQALHARLGNGLCVLDLKSPGDFCANQNLCKLMCLVCGKAMIDGEDPAFDVFRNACCEDVDELDRPSRYELQDAMDEHELVWTEQWDTPVHTWCAKKAPCKCVVPLGATMCPTHKRRLVPKPAALPKAITGMPPPAAVKPRENNNGGKLGGRVVLGTATWLKPPTLTSKTYVSGGGETMPARSTNGRQRLVPPARKPNPKLEAAAKACSYKINSWAVSRMDMDDKKAVRGGQAGGSTKFNFSKHQDEYDPYNPNHGYRLRNGAWTYGFPDGRVVPAGSVNEITPDGELIPLSF